MRSQDNFWGSGVNLFITSAETEILNWLYQSQWISLVLFNDVNKSLESTGYKRINNYNQELHTLLLQEELMEFSQQNPKNHIKLLFGLCNRE